MNRNEAAKLVAILSAAYPAAQIRPETDIAYHLALSDIPYPVAEQAVAILLRTSKFMPTAAEIREVLAEAATSIAPWESAWDEVADVVHRHGYYLFRHRTSSRHGDWTGWSSDLIEAAVNHVGYDNLCMTPLDKLPTLRAQFRDYYQAEAARRKQAVQIGDAALPSGTDTLANAPLRRIGGGAA